MWRPSGDTAPFRSRADDVGLRIYGARDQARDRCGHVALGQPPCARYRSAGKAREVARFVRVVSVSLESRGNLLDRERRESRAPATTEHGVGQALCARRHENEDRSFGRLLERLQVARDALRFHRLRRVDDSLHGVV